MIYYYLIDLNIVALDRTLLVLNLIKIFCESVFEVVEIHWMLLSY